MSLPINISSPEKEGELQVSKSRKLALLLDSSEMESLFEDLGAFEIFEGSRPVSEKEIQISKENFLSHYACYIQGIKEGKLMNEDTLRPFFSSFFTCSKEIIYAIALSNQKYLIKAKRPVIQLRRHHFIFSKGEFHSGVMGKESISWGIEFSYPNLFLDPKTKAISKIDQSSFFPNTTLFQKLAKWVRNNTLPTPFLIEKESKKVNQPMRLGKACLDWINNHPALILRGLYVGNKRNSFSAH